MQWLKRRLTRIGKAERIIAESCCSSPLEPETHSKLCKLRYICSIQVIGCCRCLLVKHRMSHWFPSCVKTKGYVKEYPIMHFFWISKTSWMLIIAWWQYTRFMLNNSGNPKQYFWNIMECDTQIINQMGGSKWSPKCLIVGITNCPQIYIYACSAGWP